MTRYLIHVARLGLRGVTLDGPRPRVDPSWPVPSFVTVDERSPTEPSADRPGREDGWDPPGAAPSAERRRVDEEVAASSSGAEPGPRPAATSAPDAGVVSGADTDAGEPVVPASAPEPVLIGARDERVERPPLARGEPERAVEPSGSAPQRAVDVRPRLVRRPSPPADIVRPARPARLASDHEGEAERVVEVRIGRVEIEVQRPAPRPVPHPQPPVAHPFERLAAGRRFLDRRWY